MIYIISALYDEAFALIEHYQLKQKDFLHGFQVFLNSEESIVLVLTGVGKIHAASAVSQLLSFIVPSPDDCLVVYGSSAGRKEGIYLANEIFDIDEKRSYYPDILMQTDLQESRFLTGSQLIYTSHQLHCNDAIYDMESSGIYQAANKFVGPHQMFFLRFVSDSSSKSTDRTSLRTLSETYAKDVIRLIDTFKNEPKKELFDELETVFVEKCHCSVTMEREIHQLFKYARISGKSYQLYINRLLEKEIGSREEGKKLIYDFRQFLIS